jgi:hypothetical protein
MGGITDEKTHPSILNWKSIGCGKKIEGMEVTRENFSN